MANRLTSFMHHAHLDIRIGNLRLAYAQGLNFTDDMDVQEVGGIGTPNYMALEPLGYIGRGQMVIRSYSDHMLSRMAPESRPRGVESTGTSQQGDGNSMMRTPHFNPLAILLAATFNIDVYVKVGANIPGQAPPASLLAWQLVDCRFANWNMSFTPGSFVNETTSFLCRYIIDLRSENATKRLASQT